VRLVPGAPDTAAKDGILMQRSNAAANVVPDAKP
jgi:hypothetical protein